MDYHILRIALITYSVVVGISILRYALFLPIPATLVVLPLFLLTSSGIVLTFLGLRGKSPTPFRHGGLFMVTGFLLGLAGLWATWLGVFENDHTADVCIYSQAVPSDPGASWACPQLAAACLMMWILIAGLVVPALFFVIVPLLAPREERRQAEAVSPQSKDSNRPLSHSSVA